MTVSSANSALHRARTALTQRYQGREAGYTTLYPGDEKTQLLLDQFVRAWETADVEGLVALLKEDAVLTMPPSPSWYQGRDAIHAFATMTVFGDEGMFGGKAGGRWQLVRTGANASPAFALYERMETNEYRAFGLHVLEYEGNFITKIVSFIDPSLPSRFGLPSVLKR
jgi:RNA polymerase sigma-70 factor (ECF subfamily)